MFRRAITALALAVALASCNKSPDSATAPVDNTPAAATTAATPAPAATAAVAPTAANPYPNGMAQNVDQCGKPGYNSDNFVCHPVGVPLAENSSDSQGLPPAINAINDQLAKLGSLSVTTMNGQGYPIFNMECNAQQQCVNGVGIPMGTLSDIASQMTTVRQVDIARYGYKCKVICKDGEDNIIGRPEAQ